MIYNYNKTGVINDPLGQPTVLAGSDCHLISNFWDRRMYVRTDTTCENSDHHRPGLRSASWINHHCQKKNKKNKNKNE